jgi:hypothetical protein
VISELVLLNSGRILVEVLVEALKMNLEAVMQVPTMVRMVKNFVAPLSKFVKQIRMY